ncbi:hypothetical protein ACHQM5_025533 [Ranunculus cassubicifolius]
MKTSILRSHFYLPRQAYLNTSPPPTTHLLNTITSKRTTYTKSNVSRNVTNLEKNKPQILKPVDEKEIQAVSTDGYSRFVALGAVTFGLAMLVAGMEDHKALAFGPEGPLMEDFWDNMRRYGLYALTVSTGALYTIFQPIVELLKNPISAILIIVILVGSFYIVSQVLTAMVGVSEFAYEYGY